MRNEFVHEITCIPITAVDCHQNIFLSCNPHFLPLKYLLGFDIGSSSVKAALIQADSGAPLASAFSPASEMIIHAPQPGFAEQDPESWWTELVNAVNLLRKKYPFAPEDIIGIGIAYQMHGLVCIDKSGKPLRPAIIWCDSRAVGYGQDAFDQLGHEFCLRHYLNSPGNFTASKLKWVRDNEPAIYDQVERVLLPGDFIALKLTGEAVSTISGFSEGIFWDFQSSGPSTDLLRHYGIDPALLAPLVPTFGEQGRVTAAAASLLGLKEGTPVSYRAGDQPNNAFSLNVLEPGEIAATAGTSGVVYGVTDQPASDSRSRVNPFVHVNHTREAARYGILMCLNGTGSLNSWLRKQFFSTLDYDAINEWAAKVPAGSGGVYWFPFGNGAERILENRNPFGSLQGLDFNRHDKWHVARAAQEGIVFALHYGTEIMKPMGVDLTRIRAGFANMFQSPLFAATFANLTGCPVELFNTDGAIGAARGAGLGSGYYASAAECFSGMKIVRQIEPNPAESERLRTVYAQWKEILEKRIL